MNTLLNSNPEYRRQYAKEEIKSVCMYCGTVLSNPEGIVVSHGICNSCLAREAVKMDIVIEEYGALAND